MKLARTVLCATVFLAFSISLIAQVSGANATAIIQRSNTAMGCAVIGGATTISVRGSLHASSLSSAMPIKIDTLGSNRWRSELDTPKEHKVTIVNAGKGQVQHGDGRTTTLAEHNTSHQRPMHIPCMTNVALPSGAIDVSYLRVETSGADSLDVIELLPSVRPHLKQTDDIMK